MCFKPVDIALIAIFSAMWAILNLTVGSLGFTFFRPPLFYFNASHMGFRQDGDPLRSRLCRRNDSFGYKPNFNTDDRFLVSAFIFDTLMIFCGHEIRFKPYDIGIASIATTVSAYVAGVIIGTIFMNRSLEWALTFWGVCT